jgi:hypothetical protein
MQERCPYVPPKCYPQVFSIWWVKPIKVVYFAFFCEYLYTGLYSGPWAYKAGALPCQPRPAALNLHFPCLFYYKCFLRIYIVIIWGREVEVTIPVRLTLYIIYISPIDLICIFIHRNEVSCLPVFKSLFYFLFWKMSIHILANFLLSH